MRYSLESGLPVLVSDDQGITPAAAQVGLQERSDELRAQHVSRLAMKRLVWWPKWTYALGRRREWSGSSPMTFHAIGNAVIAE